jgi:uncharacterized membrane protein
MTGQLAGTDRETARLEAFSDGVFAIAATLLVLDLRVPTVVEVTPTGLARAVVDEWPSYFAFTLSFATILIMWVNHHARMSLIHRVDGLLMFANGLVLFMVSTLVFPTALVGEYLTTAAGKGAVVTYALFVLGTSGAWNIFMFAMKPERGLLRQGVPADLIASTRRRVALGFVIYVGIASVALLNAYLGMCLLAAMWGFWGSVAYRALNQRRQLSTEA